MTRLRFLALRLLAAYALHLVLSLAGGSDAAAAGPSGDVLRGRMHPGDKGVSERSVELSLRVSESRKRAKRQEKCLRMKRQFRRMAWKRR